MSECAVEGCYTEDRLRRGWCIKHYQRWVRYGDTERHPRQYAPLLDRVMAKVDASGDCWEWTGRFGDHGYGSYSVSGSTKQAHRLVWELLVGPVAPGLTIDHLCRVRSCVNPDHLEPVTMRENTLRSPIAPAAVNARKTHCPRGHPYAGDNVTYSANGRACVECDRTKSREYQRRLRAQRLTLA